MNRLIFLLVPCLLVVTIISCRQKSKQVMSKDMMVDVLYDVHLANGIYSNKSSSLGDEWKSTLLASVFDKYHITQADYDSSLVWYADNIKDMMEINDSVLSRLKVDTETMMKKRNESHGEQYSTILPLKYQLNSLHPTLSFNIDSMMLKRLELPHFCLAFDVQGVSDDMKLTVGVYYKYKDTLVADVEQIADNKYYRFNKPQLPDSLLKSITGYFHLRKKDVKPFTGVNIYNIVYQDSTIVSANKE